MKKERILVIAHGHPDFQLGGGELAAYYLYKKYQNDLDVEEVFFLGCINRKRFPEGSIYLRRKNDYIWEQGADAYTLHTINTKSLYTELTNFVRSICPTVIHIHHYIGIGLETFFILKNIAPSALIWLTLHEYAAICINHGQMVKSKTKQLCYSSSPEECHYCVPKMSVEDIWIRKYFFDHAFSLVDTFIAPSFFLKQRYVEWGVAEEKITVQENWMPPMEKIPFRSPEEGEKYNRFGFFGQITPFKGLDVILEALQQIQKAKYHEIVLEINGASLEQQAASFQKYIYALCKPLIQDGVVLWRGSYHPHQLKERMASIDWVVVPSIWWENSPLVIQEALGFGRPLLVSNIGGMAEKVRNGIDGWHVPVGDRYAWGKILSKCMLQGPLNV